MNRIFHFTIFIILLNSVVSDKIELSISQQTPKARIPQCPFVTLVTSEPTYHAKWRNSITAGVSSLPKRGIPGQAIVFGMNASVVAVGDTINDVLISAGEVGNGRVVVMTHSSYGDNFTAGTNSDESIRTLHANIKGWLMRGAFCNSSFIMEVSHYLRQTNTTALKMVKILLSTEPVRDWTAENITNVLKFVRNGGGLFVSATPWGWAQDKKSNNFNLMLTYRTLLEAGIAFNRGLILGPSVFYFNKVTHLSHLGIQVDITLAPEDTSFNYSDTVKAIEQAQHLPMDVVERFQSRISLYLTPAKVQQIAPSSETKTISFYIKTRLVCYQRFFLNGNFNIAAAKHEKFPGTVNQAAPNFQYVSREFTFTAPNFQQFHHTGLYAVPGQAVRIQVLSALPNKTWQVFIGFHTDNNFKHQSWVRWPTVFNQRDLEKNTTFSCGFGGLIYLRNPSGTNETVRVRVSSAVEAPWYDSQNATSIANWPKRKNAVGAWGCAQGKWVGFCMPRASFVSVDPLQILNKYDQIQLEYNILRGTKPESGRKRYIIADIKPTVGYMHAGYPIVTQMDVATPTYIDFQFNYTSLTRLGQWALFHELGHNMQRDWWTPSGTKEITVNIFSLRATQMILGKTPKYAPWLIDKKKAAQNYLLSPNFTTWKSRAGIALMIYAQVIEDYGWDAMRNVLTSYETGNSTTYPSTEQGIIDFFWSQYSLEVGVDLSGLLQKWAVPFTSNFTQRVAGLPAYVERVNLFAP